jgi:type IV pilus assembly protein PilX
MMNKHVFTQRLAHTDHPQRQGGIALIFVLVMMTIAMAMAVISARITLGGERSSRNDRDRQLAFQAAELALGDAELDIMDAKTSTRGCTFGKDGALAIGAGCSSADESRGLCGVDAANPDTPLYKTVDWTDTTSARKYVQFGEFTSRDSGLQIGTGNGPARTPSYIIVQTQVKPQLKSSDGKTLYQIQHAYRVYALGYGSDTNTQVLLEAQIYKPIVDKSCTIGSGL